MKKYRKRPVVVEAVRYLPTLGNYKSFGQEIVDWSNNVITEYLDLDNLTNGWLAVKMPAGSARADYGDWIIKDIRGEFYPCRPDIFEQTYEEVEDNATPDSR